MRTPKIKRPPLSPIAHGIIEEIEIDGDVCVAITRNASETPVRLLHDVFHPVSPHTVTLANETHQLEICPVRQNFLNADTFSLPIDAEEPPKLHIDTEHLAKQLPHATANVPHARVPMYDARRTTYEPVIDPIFEELTIEQLLADSKTTDEVPIKTVFDEIADDATPECSFDDLLDDVAIQEELADLPEELEMVSPTLVEGRIFEPFDVAQGAESNDVRNTQYAIRTSKKTPRSLSATRVKKKRGSRSLPIGWGKILASFVGLSFGIVLPLQAMTTMQRTDTAKSDVTSRGMSGIAAISRAVTSASAQDFRQATTEFNRAARVFSLASDELRTTNAQVLGIANVLPSTRKQMQAARHLLQAGEDSARAAATLTDGLSIVASRAGEHPTDALSLFDVFVENALPDLASAHDHLESIPTSAIPDEHRDTISEAVARTGDLLTAMETFHESSGALQAFLGHKQTQRYLILFQNNTELRPTGGFWGSFAEVDVLNGELQSMHVPGGGTYDMQGQLRAFVEAPEPMQLVGARWEFQDANWFPDFPTSAQKAMWFYEQSGGPTVDGVIAVNATWVSKLINATGPIALPEHGKVIDGENFLFETQKHVELEYDKQENAPKAFIGDMAGVLVERLSHANGEDFLELGALLGTGLASQDIQIYHRDPEIQSAIARLGWDGAVLGNAGDYFMLVHTNIGGGKTDGVIDDDVAIESRMREDGRIENTVSVTRTHHGLKSSLFSGTNNVSFTRIFVPRGSELLNVEGATPPNASLFESDDTLERDTLLSRVESSALDENTGALVSESFGKTSFGHWMQTEPGTSSTLTFTYLLPPTILQEPRDSTLARTMRLVGIPPSTRHSMLIQKQPGVEYRKTAYTFFPNETTHPLWSSEETMTQFVLDQNTDGYFGMILEQTAL